MGYELIRTLAHRLLMHPVRLSVNPGSPMSFVTKQKPSIIVLIHSVLDKLHAALHRRDIFVTPSWRYADPRSGLLSGDEWQAARPIICRTLGYSADPEPVLAALTEELDQTYR